jgi:hypothetical protein
VELGGGQEWTSDPLQFASGDTIALRCDSSVRFYSGLFEESEYSAARQRSPAVFPFVRGSDTVGHEQIRQVGTATTFRVVLRVGAFAPGGRIVVGVWKSERSTLPMTPPASATPSGGLGSSVEAVAGEAAVRAAAIGAALAEDSEAERKRVRRGKRYFAVLLVVIALVGLLILWDDFIIIGFGDRSDFYNALTAEATAVLAIGVVVGGTYAMWREFVAPRPKNK